ncbi:MAG: EDSAP-1 family PEP-CTERM protein [Halioglobus sp.]
MKAVTAKFAGLAGAAIGLVMSTQASADVYGLSYLDIDNLAVIFTNVESGGPGLFTFETDQNARLNNVSDPSDGAASCSGVFPSAGDCPYVVPVLSGTAQNAPGGGLVRAENDYQKFGQTAEYSNTEAAIIDSTLVAAANGGSAPTSTEQIAESNLQSGTQASASTVVQSNTSLSFDFTAGPGGTFIVQFDAALDVKSEVTGADVGFGLAQANSSVSVLLQSNGQAQASWVPGSGSIFCGTGLTCTVTETALNLTNSTSTGGAANRAAGNGSYRLLVTGLQDGQNYNLALAATTSTNLARVNQPPPPEKIPALPPGVLLLLGCGLLTTALRALHSGATR